MGDLHMGLHGLVGHSASSVCGRRVVGGCRHRQVRVALWWLRADRTVGEGPQGGVEEEEEEVSHKEAPGAQSTPSTVYREATPP